ncbi:MAG: hypothetical protein WAW37_16865 [Syntrophobacteraceae bacterium]
MSGKYRNPRDEKPKSPAFDSGETECVWMKARVVNFKLCEREFDCAECPFDKAMKAAWNQESEDRETPT